MSAKKSIKDYELEAKFIKGCLVHPNKASLARKIYTMRHGPLPSHIFVCHKCDNPPCILDKHHFKGTCLDNVRDAVKKGRVHAAHNRPEYKARQSTSQKIAQNRPEVREKKSVAQRAALAPKSVRRKLSAALVHYFEQPGTRERASEAALRRFENPEERKKACIAQNKPGVNERRSASIKRTLALPKHRKMNHDRTVSGWETRRRNGNA